MNRRVARVGGVRVGTLFEEKSGERSVATMRSYDENAGPERRGVIHIRSCSQQPPGRAQVALSGSKQERRKAPPLHHELRAFSVVTTGAGDDLEATRERALTSAPASIST